MPDKLNWFQARAEALTGTPIRRESWRRWHTYKRSLYLWFCGSEGSPATTLSPAIPPVAEHVVLNVEHVAADFLAHDWTTLHWNAPTDPDPDPGRDIITPPGGGGGVIVGPTTPPGTPPATPPGGSGGGGSSNPSTGGGWGGGGNPPGPGGDSGGGGAGTGGGGGDPGGGNPPADPDPGGNTPQADYTPTVVLTLNPGNLDGPGCFIEVPQEGSASVSVSLPNPAGGTLNVLTISVSCLGETKLGTLGPGAGQTFQFTGPINPGAEVTASATASGGTGKTWTGTGKDSWPKICLLPVFTWSGERAIVHRCTNPAPPSNEPPVTGYDQNDIYATTGQYAVNPEPGAGKGGSNTGADYNLADNWTTTLTPFPDGQPQVTTAWIAAPGGISCTVNPDGSISNVTPAKLDVWPSGASSVTEGSCETQTNGSETGPT